MMKVWAGRELVVCLVNEMDTGSVYLAVESLPDKTLVFVILSLLLVLLPL